MIILQKVTVAQVVRKSFFDSVLSSTGYVAELRQKAVRAVFGRSGTLLAFVGVSVAAGGNNFLTKEDEFEGVCEEIRDVASRIQYSWNYEDLLKCLQKPIGLEDIDVGPAIGKGCSAVVYSAALKEEYFEDVGPQQEEACGGGCVEKIPSIHNISRFIHTYKKDDFTMKKDVRSEFLESPSNEDLQEGEEGDVHIRFSETDETLEDEEVSATRYPLALKMMFNYDIQSNALAIINAMSRETIPARKRDTTGNGQVMNILRKDVPQLPPHSNIVCMFGFFCAPVGDFHDGATLYPSAQPARINPNGYGRNMSLYLLMKRYDTSLKDILQNDSLPARYRTLLLAQLFEAVVHMTRYGIAHRDMKSDNILIDCRGQDTCPELVITDFGCALADKSYGLRVPYLTQDMDRGGNAALMAPEIITKEPGLFSILDYSKSDLWACGAIAYEIFGMNNPFYSDVNGTQLLNNYDYGVESLPEIDAPHLIGQLIHNILNPNPSARVQPEIAANIVQLYLWAPSNWFKSKDKIVESPEILEWLLSLTYKLVCDTNEKNCYVEYMLINNFLSRVRLYDIKKAIAWIVQHT